MSITIQIDDRVLRQRLKQIEEGLGETHLARALDHIGENLAEEIKQRIEENRQWGGGQFASNTAVTLARKPGSQPLIARGTFATQRIFHEMVTRTEVEIRANADQAAVLQFGARKGQFGKTRRGAPIPWGDIPARPYMPIDGAGNFHPEAHALVLELIEEYVDSITA